MEAIKKWVLEGVKVAVRYGTFAFLSAVRPLPARHCQTKSNGLLR